MKSALLLRLCSFVTLTLLFGSCSTDKDSLLSTKPSLKEADKIVLVTIDGDVSTLGEHRIPRNCDRETMRQVVGGWFSERDGGQSPPSFFLYRSVGGVTNRWKIQFKEISVTTRSSVIFQEGDRIHVNRSWL